MTYLLEFTLVLGLLYGYYRLFLWRMPQLQAHRVYLLGSLGLASLLPLLALPGPAWWPGGALPSFELPPQLIEGGTASPAPGWPGLLLGAYALGVLGMTGLFAWRLVELLRFVRRCPHEAREGYTLVYTGGQMPAGSFGRWVFWDETQDLDPMEARQILAHEVCHLRQGHSVDLLLMQLWLIAGWFHPLLWLLRRELLAVHEALADRAALHHGQRDTYRALLARQLLRQVPAWTHAFANFHLKYRVTMLNQSPSPRAHWRYLPLIPLALGLFFFVACQSDVTGQAVGEGMPSPDAMVEADAQPQPLNMTEVRQDMGYPKAAAKAGEEGTVVARVLINKQGEYVEHLIVKEAGELLTQAVEAQLPNLKFKPATKDGQPVNFWVNIPFAFKLK